MLRFWTHNITSLANISADRKNSLDINKITNNLSNKYYKILVWQYYYRDPIDNQFDATCAKINSCCKLICDQNSLMNWNYSEIITSETIQFNLIRFNSILEWNNICINFGKTMKIWNNFQTLRIEFNKGINILARNINITQITII